MSPNLAVDTFLKAPWRGENPVGEEQSFFLEGLTKEDQFLLITNLFMATATYKNFNYQIKRPLVHLYNEDLMNLMERSLSPIDFDLELATLANLEIYCRGKKTKEANSLLKNIIKNLLIG